MEELFAENFTPLVKVALTHCTSLWGASIFGATDRQASRRCFRALGAETVESISSRAPAFIVSIRIVVSKARTEVAVAHARPPQEQEHAKLQQAPRQLGALNKKAIELGSKISARSFDAALLNTPPFTMSSPSLSGVSGSLSPSSVFSALSIGRIPQPQ
jgi:hypothetical protein